MAKTGKPTKAEKPIKIISHVYPSASATVTTGPSPFFYGYKRFTKKDVNLGQEGWNNKKAPLEYSLQGGYRVKTKNDKFLERPKRNKYKTIQV